MDLLWSDFGHDSVRIHIILPSYNNKCWRRCGRWHSLENVGLAESPRSFIFISLWSSQGPNDDSHNPDWVYVGLHREFLSLKFHSAFWKYRSDRWFAFGALTWHTIFGNWRVFSMCVQNWGRKRTYQRSWPTWEDRVPCECRCHLLVVDQGR